jgi:hypothetical protein
MNGLLDILKIIAFGLNIMIILVIVMMFALLTFQTIKTLLG